MGSINSNHQLLEALTLFFLITHSSLSVNGSYISFHESQCRNHTANDIFSVQCCQNDTMLFEMITNKIKHKILINCHGKNPFYSEFLPKLNIQEAFYEVSLNSCQFPAHEPVQHILKNSLGLQKTDVLDFNTEFIDYLPTSANLKGLANMTDLSFKFKSLSTLPKDFFDELKLLRSLKISSRISSKLPAVFDSLENLKWLYIVENNFQYIPENFFKYQRKLEHLILSKNNLTTVTKDAFEGLENLLTLDLSFNNIQILQLDVFSHLINLSDINLSENRFKSLPNGLFDKNKKLYSFKLEKNHVALKQLPENLFHNLFNLQVVKIQNCQLENISSKFFENLRSLKDIDISGNNLNKLPLGLFDDQDKLKYLSLSNNKIQTLSDGSFQVTRNLEYLDLSNNQLEFLSNDILKRLTKLKTLKLENNLLGMSFNKNRLQSRSLFDHLRNLQRLVLRNNSINDIFYTKIYSNNHIYEIDLSLNNIKSINCDYDVKYFRRVRFAENPLHCDCKIRCLNEFLKDPWLLYKNSYKCQTPKVLEGRYLRDLKPTELQCYLETHQTSFLKQCSNECLYGILESYLIMNCTNGNLTKMPVQPEFDPSFSNGIKLFVEGYQITELAPRTDQNYQNIYSFSIANTNIRKLPKGYFSHMPKLKIVCLDLQLLDIPSDLFVGSTGIEEINISGMNLESLPKAIFESQIGLVKLNLSKNGLKKLEEGGFSSNIYLETLDLSHNLLESLTKEMFYQLENLKSLFLGYNRLHDVSPQAFKYTISLSEIGVENNFITTFEPFARIVKKLLRVNLSFNNISFIELTDLVKEFNFGEKKHFKFTNNNIQTITITKSNIYLHYFTELEFGYNPLSCDCNIITFLKIMRDNSKLKSLENLQCMTPAKLKDKFVSELELNELVCRSKKCPQGCQCWDQPYDSTLIVNCSNANLTELPKLSELELTPFNQIELSIEYNQLKRLKLNSEPRFQHVTKIYAAHNLIDNISSADIPRNLSYLDLSFNQLERLDPEVMKKLTESQNLPFIRLSHNPWICDCSSEKLKQFILSNKTRILDLSEIYCPDRQTFENLSFVDMCSVDTDYAVTVISTGLGIVGLSLCLLTILFFRNKERVLIWMYAHGIFLWWITEEDIDENKKYDAFVSYSSFDADFVVNEILPRLEGGPTPFKLCLHDRDWIVGAYIPDQIQKSVECSKRTIILMSQNYLQSKWTRLEFRTAHNHALNEKLSRVIVVIIGDIGEVEDLDSDLQKYVKMYTYLRWDDPWFWKKLRYAMPHTARKSHQNETTEM